jgi:hypothetical protein
MTPRPLATRQERNRPHEPGPDRPPSMPPNSPKVTRASSGQSWKLSRGGGVQINLFRSAASRHLTMANPPIAAATWALNPGQGSLRSVIG